MSQQLRRKIKSMVAVATGGSMVFCALGLYKGDDKLYRKCFMPLARTLDPETAHRMAVLAARYHLVPRIVMPDTESLRTKVFGLQFPNPVGLAAGFDKNGEAVSGLLKLGFGFVEVGSVTPLPQPGNPKPRIFRLIEDEAVINRYGFNSDGHQSVRDRLSTLDSTRKGLLCVNLGKNKSSDDANDDYVKGVECFAPIADFLVVNVSSPNTPGLRDMQRRKVLRDLLTDVLQARDRLGSRIPILVKIAPDVTYDECKDIASVILEKKIDGMVISNTTVSRPESLKSGFKTETGGLSGRPLQHLSTEAIKNMYILTKGSVPIIGVGGIFSGEDAYEKIRAGATLIEIYTALIYEGPPVVARINSELAALMRKDGFTSLAQAVGADHRKRN